MPFFVFVMHFSVNEIFVESDSLKFLTDFFCFRNVNYFFFSLSLSFYLSHSLSHSQTHTHTLSCSFCCVSSILFLLCASLSPPISLSVHFLKLSRAKYSSHLAALRLKSLMEFSRVSRMLFTHTETFHPSHELTFSFFHPPLNYKRRNRD